MKKVMVSLAASACLLIGVAGLVIPIIPGLLFIVLALALLSTEYRWAKELLERANRAFPAISASVRRIRAAVSRRTRPQSGEANFEL